MGLLILESSVNAFVTTPATSVMRRHQQPRMATQQQQQHTPIIEITANNFEMTPPIRQHVEDKLGSILERYKAIVKRCETHLTVNRNPRIPDGDTCEVVLFLHDHVVRAEERTSDMYASIDLVSHKLTRKLRKLKERAEHMRHRPKASLKTETEIMLNDEDPVEDRFDDVDIIRRKSFAVESQTVDEAKISMDDVDHDFYIFTNKDTGRMNVLYKRITGGLGLIEPDQDQPKQQSHQQSQQ